MKNIAKSRSSSAKKAVPRKLQSAAGKTTKKVKTCQSELANETIEDFADFFREQAGLTFIFIANEGNGKFSANEFGPDFLSALRLARCTLVDEDFEPVDEYGVHSGLNVDCPRLAREVTRRVNEMLRRKKTKFLLAWHVCGDSSIHLSTSDKMPWNEMQEEFAWLFREELYFYLT